MNDVLLKVKNFLFFFFIACYFFLVSGCVSPPPPIKKPSVPDWFIRTQSSEQKFYGKGGHAKQDNAIKLALSDIAGQFSISIAATTSSQQSVVNAGDQSSNFSEFSSRVASKINEINFKGYKTEKSEYVNNVYYVLVSVNKAQFIDNQKNDLQVLDKEVKQIYHSMKDSSTIQAIKLFRQMASKVSKANFTANLIASLDGQYDIGNLQNRYNDFLAKGRKRKSELSIFITPDTEPAIQVILAEFVAKEELIVIKNRKQFRPHTHILDVVTKVENSKLWDNYSVILHLELILKEQEGNIVASSNYKISASSLTNFEKAQKKAMQSFASKISSMNILQVFNIR